MKFWKARRKRHEVNTVSNLSARRWVLVHHVRSSGVSFYPLVFVSGDAVRNESILDAAERLAVKKRVEFSKKTKLQAWERSGGICECGCGVKIISGDGPEYHHRIEDAIDGGNSLENCQVLRKRCHKSITALRRPEIDKSRRTREKNIKARSRKSRPMDGSKDSRWKAKFNGPPERRW